MANRFKPVVDLNMSLRGAELRVIEIGDRKAYTDDARAKADAQDFPKFVRLQIVEDPSGINTDAEFQVKLRDASNVEIGEQFRLDAGHKKIVGGPLTFWGNKSTYRGRDWIYVNASGKGDHVDDWA